MNWMADWLMQTLTCIITFNLKDVKAGYWSSTPGRNSLSLVSFQLLLPVPVFLIEYSYFLAIDLRWCFVCMLASVQRKHFIWRKSSKSCVPSLADSGVGRTPRAVWLTKDSHNQKPPQVYQTTPFRCRPAPEPLKNEPSPRRGWGVWCSAAVAPLRLSCQSKEESARPPKRTKAFVIISTEGLSLWAAWLKTCLS